MDEHTDRIRERAYQIWVDAGQPEGHEDAHWEQARREIEGPGDDGEEGEGGKDRRLDAGLDDSFPTSDPASESQPGGGITGPAEDR